MKMYYKTDGNDQYHPFIIMKTGNRISAYWVYYNSTWTKGLNKDARMTLSWFKSNPYRISKAEAENILFLDSI